MRKKQELSDRSSCMNRAEDDEMVFVLLGRDAAAPAAVRSWIEERIKMGKNKHDDPQIVDAFRWVKTVEREQASKSFIESHSQTELKAGDVVYDPCTKQEYIIVSRTHCGSDVHAASLDSWAIGGFAGSAYRLASNYPDWELLSPDEADAAILAARKAMRGKATP